MKSKRKRVLRSSSGTDDGSREDNDALSGDSESTLRRDDTSGEENESLKRDSDPTSRTADESEEENPALQRETESSSRTDDEQGDEHDVFLDYSRTEDGFGEENEALRRESEFISRTNDVSGEENKALKREAESTSRTDDVSGEVCDVLWWQSESTSKTDGGSGEENDELSKDSKSTSGTDDKSREETEVLRRDLELASRTDDGSGEEYDVFLSFRGSDTRLNFTDCLYRSMVRVGIHVFLDSEELELGENISRVLNALNKSRIYVPIFSQNFASSTWCLREVERMVQCHSKSNETKEIIPIFYDVSTDDVKLRTDLYRNAMVEHKKKSDPDEVERWQYALKTAGKIIGRELQGRR